MVGETPTAMKKGKVPKSLELYFNKLKVYVGNEKARLNVSKVISDKYRGWHYTWLIYGSDSRAERVADYLNKTFKDKGIVAYVNNDSVFLMNVSKIKKQVEKGEYELSEIKGKLKSFLSYTKGRKSADEKQVNSKLNDIISKHFSSNNVEGSKKHIKTGTNNNRNEDRVSSSHKVKKGSDANEKMRGTAGAVSDHKNTFYGSFTFEGGTVGVDATWSGMAGFSAGFNISPVRKVDIVSPFGEGLIKSKLFSSRTILSVPFNIIFGSSYVDITLGHHPPIYDLHPLEGISTSLSRGSRPVYNIGIFTFKNGITYISPFNLFLNAALPSFQMLTSSNAYKQRGNIYVRRKGIFGKVGEAFDYALSGIGSAVSVGAKVIDGMFFKPVVSTFTTIDGLVFYFKGIFNKGRRKKVNNQTNLVRAVDIAFKKGNFWNAYVKAKGSLGMYDIKDPLAAAVLYNYMVLSSFIIDSEGGTFKYFLKHEAPVTSNLYGLWTFVSEVFSAGGLSKKQEINERIADKFYKTYYAPLFDEYVDMISDIRSGKKINFNRFLFLQLILSSALISKNVNETVDGKKRMLRLTALPVPEKYAKEIANYLRLGFNGMFNFAIEKGDIDYLSTAAFTLLTIYDHLGDKEKQTYAGYKMAMERIYPVISSISLYSKYIGDGSKLAASYLLYHNMRSDFTDILKRIGFSDEKVSSVVSEVEARFKDKADELWNIDKEDPFAFISTQSRIVGGAISRILLPGPLSYFRRSFGINPLSLIDPFSISSSSEYNSVNIPFSGSKMTLKSYIIESAPIILENLGKNYETVVDELDKVLSSLGKLKDNNGLISNSEHYMSLLTDLITINEVLVMNGANLLLAKEYIYSNEELRHKYYILLKPFLPMDITEQDDFIYASVASNSNLSTTYRSYINKYLPYFVKMVKLSKEGKFIGKEDTKFKKMIKLFDESKGMPTPIYTHLYQLGVLLQSKRGAQGLTDDEKVVLKFLMDLFNKQF